VKNFLLLSPLVLSGCFALPLAKTQGEIQSGHTYVPLDGFAVKTVPGDSCREDVRPTDTTAPQKLVGFLPDNSTRVAVRSSDAKGNVTYGAVGGLASEGKVYTVTTDYISADTANLRLVVQKTMLKWDEKSSTAGERVHVPLNEDGSSNRYLRGSEGFNVVRVPDDVVLSALADERVEIHVPIYVGIGMRVTAEVVTKKGEVNISGLGAIAAGVQANDLKGTLVVQTLGVNSKAISTTLPIQSDLNPTTIQNAIASIGSVKTLLWESDTVTSPRVVGLYLPIAGGKSLVNSIVSQLSKERLEWKAPCRGGWMPPVQR
jgi:hypothetical protein